MIGHFCHFAEFEHNAADCVDFKKVADILHDAGKTFKPHTGIDVRVGKPCVIAVAVSVKLSEHDVPDFNESVTGTAEFAVGLAATVFRTAIKMNLTVGSAGTCTDFPEVIFFTHAVYAVCGNAYLAPYLKRFVVIFVNCYIESVLRNFENFCEEFPCPRNRIFLEIIAEREVAKHFEECTVTCCFSDIVDIESAYAFLTRRDSLARRYKFTGEIALQGSHSGVDEEK
ncbi:putative uncharacterized protein [Ruminococcus sp. CAG:382]|nr:putative uncharacterized protein [Ruminococcus sp. CAG:382]